MGWRRLGPNLTRVIITEISADAARQGIKKPETRIVCGLASFPMYSISFGVGLHILLLLIYLGLIVVWLHESVHSIVFEVKEGNEAASRLSLILQIYINVRSFYPIFCQFSTSRPLGFCCDTCILHPKCFYSSTPSSSSTSDSHS